MVDSLYESVFQVDVGVEGLVIVDDSSTFDEESVTLKSQAKHYVSLEESQKIVFFFFLTFNTKLVKYFQK